MQSKSFLFRKPARFVVSKIGNIVILVFVKCAFGQMLYEKIKKTGESVPDFAGSVNTTKSTLSKMSNGVPPNMELVKRIADKLRLHGKDRQKFLDLAAIVHLPKESQARFIRMVERLEAVENTLDAL